MKRVVLTSILALMSFSLIAAEPMWQGKGRIVISSDGNEHDDDDWAATPMTLAILASQGLQDRVPLYVYSDHIWGSSNDQPNRFGMSAYEHMNVSALGSKEWFGYDKSEFICAVDDPEVAYEAMVRQINKSSKKNPLIIIGAGPMQVIGEALNRSKESKHKYITVISHSNWNNVHASKPYDKPWENNHTGWTWDQMKENFTDINFVLIANQNGGEGYPGLFNPKEKYEWIKSCEARNDTSKYKEGAWDFLYDRVASCQKKSDRYFDVSDSGMALWLLTGDDKSSPEKLEAFFTMIND